MLFLWDFVDLFTEIKRFDFLTIWTFWGYYFSRLGFSVGILGVILEINLVNISSPFVIAFSVPLIFVTLLQNLVIQLGGTEGVNIGQVFTKFRRIAIDGLFLQIDSRKAELTTQLYESGLSITDLRNECEALSTSADLPNLEKLSSGLTDPQKRMYYVKAILNWGTLQHARQILSRTRPTQS